MRDWSGEATKLFKDKVVSHVRYTTEAEMLELDCQSTPIVFFTDGSGVFWTDEEQMTIIPSGGK